MTDKPTYEVAVKVVEAAIHRWGMGSGDRSRAEDVVDALIRAGFLVPRQKGSSRP